jgi:hypothetical protein
MGLNTAVVSAFVCRGILFIDLLIVAIVWPHNPAPPLSDN